LPGTENANEPSVQRAHAESLNSDPRSIAKMLGHMTMLPDHLAVALSAISAYNSGVASSNFRT